MKGTRSLAFGLVAALCAACGPGPTVHLGKRVASAQATDAGADAGHREAESEDDEQAQCMVDSDCDDDARCDRSRGRCIGEGR